MSPAVEHSLSNRLEETRQIEGWVAKFAREQGLPTAVQRALDLALVEWITNIISYGYEDGGKHRILIRFKHSPDAVEVDIEDDGRPFDPRTVTPADISQPLEERPVGGLGVHMVRNLVDELDYRREGGRNIVTLTKRISAS